MESFSIYIYLKALSRITTLNSNALLLAAHFREDTWRTKIRNADTRLKIMQRPCGGLDRDLAQLLCRGITAIAIVNIAVKRFTAR